MLSYILRRVLYAVPILLGVLIITFFLFRGLQKPDTIAKLALGQKAPSHAITAFKEKHGLDRPMPEQFGRYLKSVVTLDFGESWKTGRSISETFAKGALPTLLVTIPGFIVGILAALGLSLYQVFVRQSRVDRAITRILNREASPAEADAMLSYVDSFQKKFAGKMTEADAWQSACRVLIASNEFMYVD